MISVDQIKLNEYNPRRDLAPGDADFERIKRSIEHFGFVEPLVWNERTGQLVGGNQRFKVLKEQGVTEVMVSVVDLDEDEEALLGIALNKVRGDWDREKLVELLQEIQDTDLDVTLTGFDGVDFDDALLWPDDEDEDGEKQSADDEGEGWIACPNCGHEFKEHLA